MKECIPLNIITPNNNKNMKSKYVRFAILASAITASQNAAASTAGAKDTFPDGTEVGEWFHNYDIMPVESLGTVYCITDYGVENDSSAVQTKAIQAVIDKAADAGGGVVRIPSGTFMSGSLFFKPGTHLLLDKGAVLKGSDDISDFDVIDTRLEGQSLRYFAALINAIGVNGFTISGEGVINGNGMRYWRSFWQRRAVNPQCTNLEELRPRLVYIAESDDVTLSGVTLMNSPFWTTHIYKCERMRLLNLTIFAPREPVKAPSSDAVDIDACHDVLIKGCDISVNDDAVVFKGGKGPTADKDERNGGNSEVIVEDCHFGFCHSAMTVGSESIHTRNVLMRRCTVDGARRILWLKMRPDTPQSYEYIDVSDIQGSAGVMFYVHPWTQFFDLKGGTEYIMSSASNVSMHDIELRCATVFDVKQADDQYSLSDFSFWNLNITADNTGSINDKVKDCTFTGVVINGEEIEASAQ